MPPTPIITKQDILNAGIQLIRENGIRSVNARSLAKSLSCSTKPLFRIYKNMEELKKDIKKELDNYYNDFMEKNMTMSGSSLQDIIHAEWNRASIENAKALTGLSTEKAEILFINFWLYSHGIATQIVSNDIDIPLDLVKKLLKNAFNRFSLETV